MVHVPRVQVLALDALGRLRKHPGQAPLSKTKNLEPDSKNPATCKV